MVVLSVTSKRLRAVFFLVAAAVLLGVLAWIIIASRGNAPVEKKEGAVQYRAGNAAERLAFVSQFGWQVDEEPFEVAEILIPAEFDDVYTNYNKIQLSQGLDLTDYAARRVKRYTYLVRNYPGNADDAESVRINLLIFEGCVIGGDVCSTALDGFMHGFSSPDAGGSTAETPTINQNETGSMPSGEGSNGTTG